MSRLRPRFALALLALVSIAAVGCTTPSNEPEAYDDTTKSNFLQGCTGIVTEGTAEDASTSSIGAGASPAVCECQYEYFVENVPFDTEAAEAAGEGPDAVNFVELNQQVQDDPNSLPQDIRDGLQQACSDVGDGGSAPVTSESQSDTTVTDGDTTPDTAAEATTPTS
jgi:hypothetical protein